MSLWAIFDPMVKNYFKDKYGESGGGSSGDYDALVSALAIRTPFILKNDSVTYIASNAFTDERVSEIDFPNVIAVNSYAFSNCTELVRINLPNVEELSNEAFRYCPKITQVYMHKLKIVGASAFQQCTGMVEASFPSITTVGERAFSVCTALKKVDFGQATVISGLAFSSCDSLETVIIRTTSTVCVADLSAFNGTPIMRGTGHIYVPSAMYEYYRAGYEPAMNDAGYTGFFDIMFRKIEDYPEICG